METNEGKRKGEKNGDGERQGGMEMERRERRSEKNGDGKRNCELEMEGSTRRIKKGSLWKRKRDGGIRRKRKKGGKEITRRIKWKKERKDDGEGERTEG